MAITTTQFLAIADNIAKALVDLESAFITGTATTDAAVNSGMTSASNSLFARYAALSTTDQAGQIGRNYQKAITAVTNYDNVLKNSLYSLFKEYLEALDYDLGGMAYYIKAGNLVVHPEFAAAFNWVAQSGRTLGLRTAPMPTIQPSNVLVPAEQLLGSIAVTGAAAGTFAAGTALTVGVYGPQQIYIKNTTLLANPVAAPVPTAATATVANASALGAGVYTVGYTFTTPAGETQLSPTATVTLTAGQQINVASIALPTGANGIKFYVSIAAGNTTVGFSGVQLSAAAATTIANLGSSAAAPSSNTAGIASTGTATSFTVTYAPVAGGANATATQALSGALAANATLAIGTTQGVSVSNIVVNSGGVNLDSFAVAVEPARAVAY